MKTTKSRGPRAEPWGTLDNTCFCRQLRYEIYQSKSSPVTPRAWSFLTRILCFAVLKTWISFVSVQPTSV